MESKRRSVANKVIGKGAKKLIVGSLTLGILVIFDQDRYTVQHDYDTLNKKYRKLLSDTCYKNIVQNGNFEADGGSVDNWFTNFDNNHLRVVEHDSGSALMISDRYKGNQGPSQNLDANVDCLHGDDFYVRIQAQVRLFYEDTGEGVTTCVDNRTHAGSIYAKNHCPSVALVTRKIGGDNIDWFEVQDVNIDWNPDGWNTYDIIAKMPPENTGDDIDYFFIRFQGGPKNAALLVDNIILTRIEAYDLPEGHAIYDPIVPACDENMIQNGNGQYQSPFGWDAYGHWFAEMGLDAVTGGESDFAIIAVDRLHPYNQGLGQILNKKCLFGKQYYIHIEADVMLYDQTTGIGIDTCSPSNKRHCVRVGFEPVIDGIGRMFTSYFDPEMMSNWKSDSWNKIDLVIAMNPHESDPDITSGTVNFLGGPPNSVLKMKNVFVRKIPYEDIPAGHTILQFTGEIAADSPIKYCRSSGDPHILTFGKNTFDNHEMGWSLLYNKDDFKLETHQSHWGETLASVNDAIRVTYRGFEYEFRNGEVPSTDNPYYHETENKLAFPDPQAQVYISQSSIEDKHMYAVWMSTRETYGADGLCVDLSETSITAAENVTKMFFNADAPTRAEAETACSDLVGTDHYEDCIFDVRAVNDPVVASTFIETAIAAVEVETDLVKDNKLLGEEGIKANVAAMQDDPLILGLQSQLFKFEGRSDTWYANLATDQVQWNIRFHRYHDCPREESMFVTAMAFTFFREHQIFHHFGQKQPQHSIIVRVKDTTSFTHECQYESGICLGNGALEIILDGKVIDIPGEYKGGIKDNLQVVAYNIFGACSRRHYDYDEDKTTQDQNHGRRLDLEKTAIDFLLETGTNRINPEVCRAWIDNRVQKGDLFQQPGDWSTIHISTPFVSFHVEYRLNQSEDGGCPFHSIDAWLSHTSSEMRGQIWQGISGETREPKYNSEDNQEMSDRQFLLSWPSDRDYEVSGPHDTVFPARRSPGGALRGIWQKSKFSLK